METFQVFLFAFWSSAVTAFGLGLLVPDDLARPVLWSGLLSGLGGAALTAMGFATGILG